LGDTCERLRGISQSEGDPIVVNVDRVNFVRRFRGGNDASAVNFEKGNYVVVKGNLAAVMKTLQDG
jgi:hypothetical protein